MGLLTYEDALPDFDIRSNSTRKDFVELGFKTTNVHDIDLKYLKGDFDVSGSAFNGGSMDEFITAYIAPGMAYKDVNISYYKIPTHSIDRNNFRERTQWSNYNERDNIYWHQVTLDSGEIEWSRVVRGVDNGIESVESNEDFSSNDFTVSEINSMLRKDGIPESINFSNLRVDYDVDELRDIFSVSDDSNLVDNNQDQMLSGNSVDQLIGKKKRVDEFKLDSSPNFKQPDEIINFWAKEGDSILISQDKFGVSDPSFAISKKKKKLKKLLSKDIEFIYDKKEKEMIFNANLSEPGYGEEGGIFAILSGKTNIKSMTIEFF